MDASALVCNTSIHKKLAPQPQGNHFSDFKPFVPNYQSINFMPVNSSLHQVRDCEFDHTYILSHLEQLEIDPTLCSKCSIASKYFASPELFVQDLYKRSCHWQKVPEASNTMDIKPYADLVKPYSHIENIEI